MRFPFACLLLCLRLLSFWIRTLPGPSKGRALEEEIQALHRKGAVEPAPPTPGFYSRMFVVTKATGGWRPIIDLSTLNLSVDRTPFRMETSQTVLRSVRRNDWMISIELKDAYLQIPIHPASRRYLRFTAGGRTWQFRVLCFGLSTAPQVFTCAMAPVSGFLHQVGVRMLQYLDDWLILASSREEACWARDQVLSLCQELGIVVNLEKFTLTPSQQITYLGIRIDSQTFRASATPSRIEKFSIVEEFLSSKVQSAKFWRVLLGHLASLSRLVSNGQLRMRALQLALSRGWDFWDEEVLVLWDLPSWDDLRWWCTEGRLDEGISLALCSPDLMFWSDASNHSWGGTVADRFVSGFWLEGEASLSINHRELLAVERGLRVLSACLEGRVVAVFSDNTTAVTYLRRQRGTLSPALNAVAQRILRWAEQLNIVLMPQFVPGGNNVVADALSRPNQVIGSEWVLHQEVFNWLRERWPVTIDLFASSLSHRCFVYFAPVSDPMAAGTDAMLQSWDSLQAYAFPPFAMISQVLAKVRASKSLDLTVIAPFWPQRPWFPELLELLILPPLPLSSRWDLLRQPHVRKVPSEPVHALYSCVETLRRFARASGFSRSVARRFGQARRQSSVANYQSKWLTYHRWCLDKGHSVSNPSISKVADYLVLALGGSGFVAVFGQGPPLYAVLCLSS